MSDHDDDLDRIERWAGIGGTVVLTAAILYLLVHVVVAAWQGFIF